MNLHGRSALVSMVSMVPSVSFSFVSLASAASALLLAACSEAPATLGEVGTANHEEAVTVDTSTSIGKRQHAANIDFALRYRAACTSAAPSDGGTRRPRALVTGFNRFSNHVHNATGQIVTRLVPGMAYPVNTSPDAGVVDDPALHTRAAMTTIHLPSAGEVDVCVMVLPVFWDLASALVAKELEAFVPDVVFMNGVAGTRQPLWIELGAINRAQLSDDGSDRLRPFATPQGDDPKLVNESDAPDATRLYLSWSAVKNAASQAIAAAAASRDDGVRFDAILPGVRIQSYPRASNAYLCNNTTYVVDYLMSHPGRSIELLSASEVNDAGPSHLDVSVSADLRTVPRVFMHWPSDLEGAHLDSSAGVVRAMLDAQLTAVRNGDAPTLADNRFADL